MLAEPQETITLPDHQSAGEPQPNRGNPTEGRRAEDKISQQGRKGHKEELCVSRLCGLCGLVAKFSLCVLV
jgi:hypothetical protein